MARALETFLLYIFDTEPRPLPGGPICAVERMRQRHPGLPWLHMGCPLGVLRAFARQHPDVIGRAAANGDAEARDLLAYLAAEAAGDAVNQILE